MIAKILIKTILNTKNYPNYEKLKLLTINTTTGSYLRSITIQYFVKKNETTFNEIDDIEDEKMKETKEMKEMKEMKGGKFMSYNKKLNTNIPALKKIQI